MLSAADDLASTRPTAVNLFWALDEMSGYGTRSACCARPARPEIAEGHRRRDPAPIGWRETATSPTRSARTRSRWPPTPPACRFTWPPPYPPSTPPPRPAPKIPIEERGGEELLRIGGQAVAPDGARARYPAFDVTPAELIRAIITDRGAFAPGEAAAATR